MDYFQNNRVCNKYVQLYKGRTYCTEREYTICNIGNPSHTFYKPYVRLQNSTAVSYVLNGKLHNRNGPALIQYENGLPIYVEYWIYGKKVTFENFKKHIDITNKYSY